MKSKEERQAEKVEKVARMNARFDAFRAKMDAKSAALDEQMKADRLARQEARVAQPALYAPSLLGTVAGAIIPGVAIVQAVKSDRSAKSFYDAMTPEQQAQARSFPMGQGGS